MISRQILIDISLSILIAIMSDVSVDLFWGRSRRREAGVEPTGRAQRRIHGVP
mgnify:FL=1|jgi:hypothetical protein